jgi:hypothetical protein
MATLQWALTCQRAITDRDTNSMSYIDVVEAFGVPSFPFFFPPICVSTLWRRENREDTLHPRIRVQDPTGKTILKFESDKSLELTKKRHRLNVILGGGEITQAGEYRILVEQLKGDRWKRESVLPMDVSQVSGEAEPQKQKRRKKRSGRPR